MKKNFKLVLALVLAAMMIVSMIPAMGASGTLNVNSTLTVSGLDEGDEIALYHILEWDSDSEQPASGWKWSDGVNASSIPSSDTVFSNLVGTTDGSGQISAADASTLAKYCGTAVNLGTANKANASGVWSYDVGTEAGLYMVIVTPKNAGTMYNPIFVAANYYGGAGYGDAPDQSNAWAVIENSATYSDSAMAKKTVIDLEKTVVGSDTATQELLTNTAGEASNAAFAADSGETMTFTVTTHAPKYGENYIDPVFTLTDNLKGLALTGAITVYAVDGDGTETALGTADCDVKYYKEGAEVAANGATKYTVEFTNNFLYGKAGTTVVNGAVGTDIKVVYTAKVTDDCEKIVNQEDNTVDLKFSTEPSDQTGKGRLRDQTNHFTFSIDAGLLGHGDINGSSTEAIKVGVDKEGNPIIETSHYEWSNQYHAPLEGAEFQLFTDAACEHPYTNDLYPTECKVTSDATGRITIKGLDAGKYWLKELSAPAGWIKLQTAVPVEISAVINENISAKDELETSETGLTEVVTVYYKTNSLESYSVKVGGYTTFYTIDLSESSALATEADRQTTQSAPSSDTELMNTKGVELPSTGGIGTTIFYIGGSILVLAAAILLITKRRMGAED